LLFKIEHAKEYFELHRQQFGHMPSRGLASPGSNKDTPCHSHKQLRTTINLTDPEVGLHYQQILEQSL
jgi:hypothetical protein